MVRSSVVGGISATVAIISNIAMIIWNFVWMGLGGQVSGWVQLGVMLIPTVLAALLMGVRVYQIYKKGVGNYWRYFKTREL